MRLYTEFKHPFHQSACIDRLVDEYNKYNGKLIVAFDFDNTIFDYHNDGGNYSNVISLLKECSEEGFIMILFTSNEDEDRLKWMLEYCKHYGIRVDYINESPIMNTRKPYYNILLDDRSGLQEAFTILDTLIYRIKNNHASIKFNKTREE